MATSATNRQMTLVAFLQAQNCSNYPASWRHAATTPDFLTAEYYQRIARTLEAGRFHLAFFDDRLAMPDRYGDDHAEAVRHGIRVVKLDLIPLMTAMGLATRHLGIGGTYSTTYYEPFHVARVFATLDHMVGGRAAWNVVTSLNDSEAANFGQASHPDHDARYDRADEFVEAVLGHWDTWEDDAIVLDRSGASSPTPPRCTASTIAGASFRTRGPFTVPRTPQGHPVLIQAGQSGRGRRFAARWGELIFVISPTRELGRRTYREFKDEVARAGRDPARVRLTPAVYCVVGETQGRGRGQGGLHRVARPSPRRAGPAIRGAQLRLRLPRPRRAVLRRGPAFDQRAPGDPRPGRAALRHAEPDDARLHRAQRPGHGARDAALRGQRRARWRTGSRSGSRARRATASCWPPPTCPAPTRTSCASWCRSSSAAASSTGSTRAPRCGRTSGLRAPARRVARLDRLEVSERGV